MSIAPANSTEVRRYGVIGGTLDAVDKLVKKLSHDGVELRFVYEAGPCGFVICRHLRSKGIYCQVVAPSLIPRKASDRVKTDRCDADQRQARNRLKGFLLRLGFRYSGKSSWKDAHIEVQVGESGTSASVNIGRDPELSPDSQAQRS